MMEFTINGFVTIKKTLFMLLSLGPHSSNLMKGGWKDLNKLGFLGCKNMPGILGVLSVFFSYFEAYVWC